MKAIKTATDSTKTYIRDYPANFRKKTPKWAKILKWTGIGLTALSTSLIAAPVTVPASILGWIAAGGTFTTLLAQGFKDEK